MIVTTPRKTPTMVVVSALLCIVHRNMLQSGKQVEMQQPANDWMGYVWCVYTQHLHMFKLGRCVIVRRLHALPHLQICPAARTVQTMWH
jgi:hypothetical protein